MAQPEIIMFKDEQYQLDDFQYYCQHTNLVIEEPCCNGNNCACRGVETVYCPNPDCNAEIDTFELMKGLYNDEED